MSKAFTISYHCIADCGEHGHLPSSDCSQCEKVRRCVKCRAISGDGWSQCHGECPIPGSPHYKKG